MADEHLQSFYTSAVLPQFGIEDDAITWEASRELGPDELTFRFKSEGQTYVLIFEDYFGLGRSEDFIKEHLDFSKGEYEFMPPLSAEDKDRLPSYVGFKLPVPFKYCEGVTGTFTLLKVLKASPVKPA
ncbi:MAG TPA: hypothetical protein VJM32_02915 [Candidatus Saccharimonadales bacterium]|nr:hypothetical protein [Candidatus Saccharimonadales bacterium]